MKTRYAFIGLFMVLPLTAGVFSPIAQAQTTGTDSSPCAISPADVDAVTAAQAQGIAAELTARKALLTKTIRCAEADAQSLIDQLKALSAVPNGDAIKNQLLGKLNDAQNYYDIELGKVSDAGIAGTQAIAREVLAWRASNYAPLVDQISNFILWASNQTLLKTANDRLAQMRNIVAFLEEAGAQAALENSLGSASSLIESANNKNDDARTALVQLLPPDQSLDLIKQSLSSLADAYAKFSDMSAIIQKLLPTSAK